MHSLEGQVRVCRNSSDDGAVAGIALADEAGLVHEIHVCLEVSLESNLVTHSKLGAFKSFKFIEGWVRKARLQMHGCRFPLRLLLKEPFKCR